VGLYFLSLAVLWNLPHNNFKTLSELPVFEDKDYLALKKELDDNHKKDPLQFNDPILAYKVLSLLDVYKPVHESNFVYPGFNVSKFHRPYLGFKSDDQYCEKHRLQFVNHPRTIFKEMNVIFAVGHQHLIREKVVPGIGGNDIQPKIGDHMPKRERDSFMYDISPRVNLFWSSGPMNEYKHLGSEYSCLSQMSNHIFGHRALSRKDTVAENAIKYEKSFRNRSHCFNHNKFFPKTWLLTNKQDCMEFFSKLNSQEYTKLKKERSIVYIRKISFGSHRGHGVQPVTQEEENDLRKLYRNGKDCGKVEKSYIIQHYIHNPILLNGRKFDFRIYLLVASTNPLIAFYHDGFLRVTLASYDVSSGDKKALLTNLALNKQIYDDVKGGNLYEGMDEEELKIAQQWSYERLQEYLLKKGMIKDPHWLDNYLRPEFKKAMIHLLRMTEHAFTKESTTYELFGVDFMLDTDLNVWFIEANSGPAIGGYSIPMEKFIVGMVQDQFEIVMGILRSRMKRVIQYVNRLIETGQVVEGENDSIVVHNLEERRKEFEDVIKNSFDQEFEPSPGNGFKKIIDGHYKGVKKYQGYIELECL